MKRDELEIISIGESELRKIRLTEYLSSSSPVGEDFLYKLLNDPYDVIRAEIVDHIIVNDILIDDNNIIKILNKEESEIVISRLFLLIGKMNMVKTLESFRWTIDSDYKQMYLFAGMCLAKRNIQDFASLCAFLFSREDHLRLSAFDLASYVISVDDKEVLKDFTSIAVKFRPDLADRLKHSLDG